MDRALFGSRRHDAARRQASGSSPRKSEEQTHSAGQPGFRSPKTTSMPPRRALGMLKQNGPNQLSIKQYAASTCIAIPLSLVRSVACVMPTANSTLIDFEIILLALMQSLRTCSMHNDVAGPFTWPVLCIQGRAHAHARADADAGAGGSCQAGSRAGAGAAACGR